MVRSDGWGRNFENTMGNRKSPYFRPQNIYFVKYIVQLSDRKCATQWRDCALLLRTLRGRRKMTSVSADSTKPEVFDRLDQRRFLRSGGMGKAEAMPRRFGGYDIVSKSVSQERMA